jgi:hypothetical protein
VSTILKALEKLEREKEARRATGPIPVFSVPGSATGGQAGWFLKPWLQWGLVGFIIVVLGGTTWYFYRQSRVYTPRLAARSDTMDHHPARRPAEIHNQAAPPSLPDAAKPEPRQPDRSSHPDRMTADRQLSVDQMHPTAIGDDGHLSRPVVEPSVSRNLRLPPAQEKPAVRKPTPAVGPAGPSNSAIQRETPERVPGAGIPAAVEESAKVVPAPANSPVQPDSASGRNAPSDAYENTPLLTDGRLRVHAIAWSPQPAERVAVINSRVIYEGDSVEDFVVVVIRPDDVVVREKEKGVWRVEFGRP